MIIFILFDFIWLYLCKDVSYISMIYVTACVYNSLSSEIIKFFWFWINSIFDISLLCFFTLKAQAFQFEGLLFAAYLFIK